MAALDQILAAIDNAKRVARRNIRDFATDPRHYNEMRVDALVNQLERREPVANRRGLALRDLTPDERMQQTVDAVLNNLGGGGMGALGVIKNKGGNWLKGSIENESSRLKPAGTNYSKADLDKAEDLLRRSAEGQFDTIKPEIAAVNLDMFRRNRAVANWIEGPLTKYFRDEMATPQDPVRLAIDAFPAKQAPVLQKLRDQIVKATAKRDAAQQERGFTPEMMTRSNAIIRDLQKKLDFEEARTGLHYDPNIDLEDTPARFLRKARREAGFPEMEVAATPLAQKWERTADQTVRPVKAEDILVNDFPGGYPDALKNDPWLAKVDPNTPVYDPMLARQETGFGHLVDELTNALNPESGLPADMLLDPKNLGKMTVPQMIEHVDKINAWRAMQKAEADAARANNAATVLYKEYKENNPRGLRWVELKAPEVKPPEGYEYDPVRGYYHNPWDETVQPTNLKAEKEAAEKQLQDALKYEGDMLQHCVGGEEYCTKVLNNESRIFSLRDESGRPHTTIEVKPEPILGPVDWFNYAAPNEVRNRYSRPTNDLGGALRKWGKELGASPEYTAYVEEVSKNPLLEIAQIKSTLNRAPLDEFIPYVQDFVRLGNWSNVKDIGHAKMVDMRNRFGNKLPEGTSPYMTYEEQATFNKQYPELTTQGYDEAGGLDGEPEFRNGGLIRRRGV